jgi:hypothetical protein
MLRMLQVVHESQVITIFAAFTMSLFPLWELVWNLGGYTAAPGPDGSSTDSDTRPEGRGVPTIPAARSGS